MSAPNAFAAALFLAVASLAGSAMAQQAGGQDLSQAANDPTAALMAFQLQNSYSPSITGTDGASQNFLQFRAAIPFEIGGLQNIFRVTLPYFTDTPSGDRPFRHGPFQPCHLRPVLGPVRSRCAVALVPTGATG
jgi:hypothetical protein